MTKLFLRPKEVAALLGISWKTVRRYSRNPETRFPKPVILQGHHHNEAKAIEQWFSAQCEAANPRKSA
jgi:predicted DNA-binding transcriptional regulator AlpA